jgi:hypothetical protein
MVPAQGEQQDHHPRQQQRFCAQPLRAADADEEIGGHVKMHAVGPDEAGAEDQRQCRQQHQSNDDAIIDQPADPGDLYPERRVEGRQHVGARAGR